MKLLNYSWLLFSDLTSRFNTLIDEYAHLQSTVVGLLPKDFRYEDLFAHPEEPYAERPFLPKVDYRNLNNDCNGTSSFGRSKRYYGLTNTQKTYCELIHLLGGLAAGLQKNKATCFETYKKFVERAQCDSPSEDRRANEAFFWFMAQRGYFIGDGFLFYASQLEHAHEKLIQVLETSPGAMPQPILLRRWNSASYEDFLSGYFKHVKWEVRSLIKRLHPDRTAPSTDNHTITHSWSHMPTSEVTQFRQDGKVLLGSVRSAFFYLEQPALFPLLYHESAHFYLSQFTTRVGNPGGFLDSMLDASDALANGIRFPIENRNWLPRYATEIWIDAISIRLGGVPYVAALFSQIAGCATPGFYSAFSNDSNVIDLDRFGKEGMRLYEVHEPYESDGYLWEARLRLAVRLCKKLGIEKASKAEIDWLDSAELIIDAWHRGGCEVNTGHVTSVEHETFWHVRREINDWVESVLWDFLKTSSNELLEYKLNDNYCFPVTSGESKECNPQALVAEAVKRYKANTLGVSEESVSADSGLDGLRRIDACPLAVRWVVSKCLTHAMARSPDGGVGTFSACIQPFADYIRHDGHTAFRIGVEWHLTRESVFAYIADVIEKESDSAGSLTKQAFCKFDEFDTEFSQYLDVLCKCLVKTSASDRISLVYWLRTRQFDNHKDNSCENVSPSFSEVIVKLSDLSTATFVDAFKRALPDQNEVRVGTLVLGVVRATEIADVGNGEAFLSTLGRARQYFATQVEILNKRRSEIKPFSSPKVQSEFHGLIGDYSFMVFTEGVTPVEKSIHPSALPKMLIKPRAVLKVASNDKNCSELDLGKVTLLRSPYRFNWISLARKLEKNDLVFTLFLSSGWEDVVLVTWHKDVSAMQASRIQLGLMHYGFEEHDAQSCLAFRSIDKSANPQSYSAPSWDSSSSPNEQHWLKYLQALVADKKFPISRIADSLGRYDFMLEWEPGLSLAELVDCLNMLPREFWRPVSAYSVGIHQCICELPSKPSDSTFVMRMVLH